MALYLCSDDHDEICHEGSKCPVCEIIKEKNDEITEQQDQIRALEEDQGDG